VWARGGIALAACPKPLITPESAGLVEQFFVWKRLGAAAFPELTARQVEAFVILESAMEEERNHGERRTRDAV
jgi:hypothetical protein